MKILIANVGNVRMNEVKVLAEALNKNHRVTIACMAADGNYRGLAFTSNDAPVCVSPLAYDEIVKNTSWTATKDITALKTVEPRGKKSAFDGIAAYEFFANPADAISIMLAEIMVHDKPDLVICGINNGVHMGQDIYSSGNIAMAMESAFFRIPAIAVAMEWTAGSHAVVQLENAVKFIEKNVETFAKMKLPQNTFLNINIPTVDKYKNFKGIKVSRMGKMTQLSEYAERADTKNNKYYWPKKAERRNAEHQEVWSRTWFDQGYITIVPFNYDATDYEAVDNWANGVIAAIKELSEEGGDYE